MPGGWEGNRRSGVALAMRHRLGLQWFIHQRAHSLRKGDEHPAYTPRHTRTVVRERCKGDDESQGKRGKFDPRHPKSLNRWSPKFV